MGYVRRRPHYRLVFEDPECAGLEVVAKSTSVAAYQTIAEFAAGISTPPTPEEIGRLNELYEAFAQVLVSWNLEEPILDDQGAEVGTRAIPATLAGLNSQDLPFVLMIIHAWMETVAGVTADLGRPSVDGVQELEASMPMRVLS